MEIGYTMSDLKRILYKFDDIQKEKFKKTYRHYNKNDIEGKNLFVDLELSNLEKIIELEELTGIDALTGLPNKRRFYTDLEHYFNEFKRESEEIDFSIMVADIDYFKPFNDNYGHLHGDLVLVKVGNLLKDHLRTSSLDTLYRWGGEEFVVILPKTSINEAYIVAERMRKELEKTSNREIQIYKRTITASFGIASIKHDEIFNIEKLFEKADENSNTAKNNGRNQVYPVIQHLNL